MRAIYRQMRPHWKSPRYEVIVIRIAKEHTWPDGNTTPEHEAYPSSSSWGSLGTSHYTLVEAQERLARVASAQEGR